MAKERPIGITIFGILLMCVSVLFLLTGEFAESVKHSRGLRFEISNIVLLGWLVPAFLGIGILKLSNFFRIVAISMSSLLILWTPLMFFYLRRTYEKIGVKTALFTKYEIVDLSLIVFSLCAIYFFTRPNVKCHFT